MGLLFPVMAIDDALRKHLKRVLELGVTQKDLAKNLGIKPGSESQLSRFLSKERPDALGFKELEHFQDYLDRMDDVVKAAQAAFPRGAPLEPSPAAKKRAS